jgi:hypothetical protein
MELPMEISWQFHVFFFSFSKSFISSTCQYITVTGPFIHVLQKKAPRKHPQHINKINDNANNSN